MFAEPLEHGLRALEVARCDQRFDRGGERACRVAGPQADALFRLDQGQQMLDRGVHISQREPQKPEGELAADQTEMISVSPRKTRGALAGANSIILVPEVRLDQRAGRSPPGLSEGQVRATELPCSPRVGACQPR